MKIRFISLFLLTSLLLIGCEMDSTPLPTPSSDESGSIADTENQKKEPRANELRTVVLATRYGPESWAKETTQGINLLLEQMGTPLRLELRTYPGFMLSTEGKEIDLFGADFDKYLGEDVQLDLFVTDFGEETIKFARGGYVVDISQHLLRYPDLFRTTPDRAWKESMVDGRIVCFPLLMRYGGELEIDYRLEMRPDVLRDLAVPFPETPRALVDILQTAQAKSSENSVLFRNRLLCALETPPLPLHRTYDEWPFMVDKMSRFVMYNDGTVGPYIGSDIFLQDHAFMTELNKQGLLVVEKANNLKDNHIAGAAFWPKYTPPPLEYMVFDENGSIGSTSDIVSRGDFISNGELVRIGPCAMMAIYVSTRCKDIEAALAVLELLYTQKELSYMLFYGPDGPESEQARRRYSYRRELTHELQELAYRGTPYIEEPSGAFLGSGFSFDEEGVGNEVWKDIDFADVWALRTDALPIDQMDVILGNLNAQGYQEMLAECQRQYTEYITRFQ